MQRAQVGATEGLGRDADLEPGPVGVVEGSDRETCSFRLEFSCCRSDGSALGRTIDTYAVAEMYVGENLRALSDGQRRSPAPAGGGVELLQGRDR